MGSNAPFLVDISGIPAGEQSGEYNALVYANTAGGLVGPLPDCAFLYGTIPDTGDATQGAFLASGWASGPSTALAASATGFTVVLVPGAYPPSSFACLTAAPAVPLAVPVIATVSVSRPAASPTPSFGATPTPSPTVGPPAIVITAFPAMAGLSAITGYVANLADPVVREPAGDSNPGDASPVVVNVAVLYVQDAYSNWWIKPFPNSYTLLLINNSFAFNVWASSPASE